VLPTEEDMKTYNRNYGKEVKNISIKPNAGILIQKKIKIEMRYNTCLMFTSSVEEK
jgi:hypothetical protein